jgi:hypothetical protein
VEPGIAANSIIGVTGSAHIEGAESELVVPYEHSMQSKPEVIGEVQRILHHHLELNSCATETTTPAQGAMRESSAEVH